AGRILIKPMHETRALAILRAQDAGHAIDVPRCARTALHGKSHRLVEHKHLTVFVKRDRSQKGAILVRCRPVIAWRRRCNFQWRNAYSIPRLKARFGLGALPVYAHFAFANDALDVAERQTGKPCFEKPVDPHPGFVGTDSGGFHLDFAPDHARGCGRRWIASGKGERGVFSRAPGRSPRPAGPRVPPP